MTRALRKHDKFIHQLEVKDKALVKKDKEFESRIAALEAKLSESESDAKA